MGRSTAPPPLDVEIVRQTIAVRQDGALIRRESRMSAFRGEPAIFQGMVAFRHDGITRRIAAPRVAYALATGQWPKGQVKPKDGDYNNLLFDNLEVVRGLPHKPSQRGGKSSSLIKRQAADLELIQVMIANANASVEELGQLTGVSRARASTRLTKLAKQGLATSPMCVPGRSWCLTGAGRAAAMGEVPLLDHLDKDILAALRLVGMGVSKLARRIQVCEMTVKRRCKSLIGRGLVFFDPRGFYTLTNEGRQTLGDTAPRRPWVDVTRISAAAARDVQERSPDDRTSAMKSAHASLAKGKVLAGAKQQRSGKWNYEYGLTG